MKKIWKKMLFAGVVFFALAMVNSSGRNLVASNGFLIANGELVEYSGGASHVRVPSGVKSIGAAFKNCKKLRQYPFHKGLGSIGKEAFSGCILFQKANLPNSVKKNGRQAFERCHSLKKIR